MTSSTYNIMPIAIWCAHGPWRLKEVPRGRGGSRLELRPQIGHPTRPTYLVNGAGTKITDDDIQRPSKKRGELLDEDTDEVIDVVLLWWRDGDGDLAADTPMDAIGPSPRTVCDGVVTLKTGPATGQVARRDSRGRRRPQLG